MEVRVFRSGSGRVDVEAGSSVTWTNEDAIVHTVTSGTPERPDGRFDRRLDGTGARATVEFEAPGVYPYVGDRQPSMRGAFLQSANPNLPKAVVADLVKHHVLTVEAVADAHAARDPGRALMAVLAAGGHMQAVADPLADAIAKQLPDRYPG